MSLISRHAIALALLALSGTAASAQGPLVPYQPAHHHPLVKVPLPTTSAPVLAYGRSSVTMPRSGSSRISSAPNRAFGAITGLIVAIDPWTSGDPPRF